jgi:hypothetical protein
MFDSNFELVLQGARYAVPKCSLDQFFTLRPELFTASFYEVQSAVPPALFTQFAQSLQTGQKIEVTADNVDFFLLLSHEFSLPGLRAACSQFLERPPNTFPDLAERLLLLERQLASSSWRAVQMTLASLETRLTSLEQLVNVPASPSIAPSPSPPPSIAPSPPPPVTFESPPITGPVTLEFPLRQAGSLEGIVAHLTRKAGGNIVEKKVISMDAKSYQSLTRHVTVPDTAHSFYSMNTPREWITWDFRDKRITPKQYTLMSQWLQSWDLEGSIDGSSWFRLDRQAKNQDFKEYGAHSASFAIGSPKECRFFKLTQTGVSHNRDDYLIVFSVEFFGTLTE